MKTVNNFLNNLKVMDIILDTLEKPAPVVNGIYFSKRSGKFFEATKKWNNVYIRYCDESEGMKITPVIFRAQFEVYEFYELLIPYEEGK